MPAVTVPSSLEKTRNENSLSWSGSTPVATGGSIVVMRSPG